MISQQITLLLISLILMTSFLMLMQSRIFNLVKLLIWQNILLAIYLTLQLFYAVSLELIISLSITFLVKIILLPWLLWRLVSYLHLSWRIDPLINKPLLMFTGILLTAFAFVISYQIKALIGDQAVISFSLSLANTLLAVLLIMFRKKAISQVIGLLVIENSMFLLSITLTNGFPWVVELGIGFDILIGFMIFALFLIRIRTTHGSLEMRHLEKLKETV